MVVRLDQTIAQYISLLAVQLRRLKSNDSDDRALHFCAQIERFEVESSESNEEVRVGAFCGTPSIIKPDIDLESDLPKST